MTLPYADARKLVDDAREHGLELGKALSIAVVDYGGFVVLVERMDGARAMPPSIALSKADSAAVMQRPTSMLEGWRNSDPVFFTPVGQMGQHPIVATKGGYTLKPDGQIVGGLWAASGDGRAIAEAEDEAAVALAHALRRLTLSAVSDGQFRRAFFESVAYDHIEGFAAADGPTEYAPLSDLAGIPRSRRRTVGATPR